jgi:hypothetical protein
VLRLERKKSGRRVKDGLLTAAWSHWPTKSKPIPQPSTDNSQVEGRVRSDTSQAP